MTCVSLSFAVRPGFKPKQPHAEGGYYGRMWQWVSTVYASWYSPICAILFVLPRTPTSRYDERGHKVKSPQRQEQVPIGS